MNIVLFFCYCWVSYLRLLKKPPQFEQIEQEVQLQWTPGIYRSNQNYCITISMQKIRSIHKLILKIQQILSSNELKSKGFFLPNPPKNRWINFWLSRISTNIQKVSLFLLFIFEIESILNSRDQTGHIHFWPCPHQIFSIII